MPKHILRLLVLIAGVAGFGMVAKAYFTADSFYQYGHYRGDSIKQIAAREPAYQTPRYCVACHGERHAQWSANSHKSVICEVCHGAAEGHPQNGKLPVPHDTARLCSLCHEAMPGRPRTQPQVEIASHASRQQCVVCHNPHAPKIAMGVARVAGDPVEGKKRGVAACAGCHGELGLSPNDTWPNLAGQHPAYLQRMLAAYKSGAQQDVMMSPLSEALSDADIANLASYYGSLRCRTAAARSNAGDAAAGKALSRNCAVCHGDTGLTANAAWPHLAGQKLTYLVNALKAFRAGLRKDPMMAGVTRGLSDTDIANLAAYYAEQSCEPTVQARSR